MPEYIFCSLCGNVADPALWLAASCTNVCEDCADRIQQARAALELAPLGGKLQRFNIILQEGSSDN